MVKFEEAKNIFFELCALTNKMHLFFWYLSNPKPEHTTGGAGRRGAQRGGGARRAGQNRTPTCRVAHKPADSPARQSIVENYLERPFASTNKGNLCKPMEDQNAPLTRSLSARPRALFVPGC